MEERPRYRVEDGKACIDISLKSSRHLFDGRDPAPFRERDLDEDAVEYVLSSAQEIPRDEPLRIVLLFSDEPEPRTPPEVLREAFLTHFAWEREKVGRKLREHLRRGRLTLLVGLVVLIGFLLLAELTATLQAGHLRQILREGLVITGWVAMWRPLEVLLYDWWPFLTTRRRIDRILAADVAIRYGRVEVGRVVEAPAAATG